MLREFKEVRQVGEGFRRLFTDELFDLYLWYKEKDSDINGFQLVYTLGKTRKALTWTEREGYFHSDVDGWDSHRFNRTPLLVEDGVFEYNQILSDFKSSVQGLDSEERDFILQKIIDYRSPDA